MLTTSTQKTDPRTYQVRTFGCQMNVHDSERMAGTLEAAGYTRHEGDSIPDLIVFNTCAVRENADNRLYGTLGNLVPWKKKNPRLQIAVGGCLAQKDKDVVTTKAPWVDVVFGTHNVGSLPVLLERARHNDKAAVEIAENLQHFPSHLPSRRDSHSSAWVSISVGCNNTCTFCIVPSLRGKEIDRHPDEVVAEVKALVADGCVEVTLLGQNVNAYGQSFEDPTLERDREAFSKLLRRVGAIEGLERLRFTSPHPAEFTDDVITAMKETPNVCPQLHMPLQSGSDTVLKRMKRSYRQAKFLDIVNRVKAEIPGAAITTDIIVGFPGETEEDFQDTLDVVQQAQFSMAYTFQYSIRPGTPAGSYEDQIPKAVVQERYERLWQAQEDITLALNEKLVGSTVEILVSADEGRKNHETNRMSGRGVDGRLVHFAPGKLTGKVRPGDFVTVHIDRAAPHHLIADGDIVEHRPTVAGDRWDAGEEPTNIPPVAQPTGNTSLGLPSFRPSN